ncbi:hypothetical protein LZ518_01725 [Sphingomonas sp. RB56-2]|uniref:Uncharacterized protein n=1 Tax=Sphingomonas brevis TaxID=2908206 RepID=A0ABT0S687_9SPHN|nr:hypothetical protein [Sphingomonas brevis]MCL6739858.1 hypothetical protein [Sphingomonas brevis]
MFARSLLVFSALCLAAPAAAEPSDGGSGAGSKRDPAGQTGGNSYGDRNRGGPYGFYSYPRHRSIDGGGSGLDRNSSSAATAGTPGFCDTCHGSAYYGPNYGAPYFGGGYYDDGTYYRERRD